jgi:hypothetical protein
MIYYGDLQALEDLPNKSICVKEEKGIRKINSDEDLNKFELVFVNNIAPEGETLDLIKKGMMVRYRKVNIIG